MIPIVFAADNNYIVPTITAITSLLANKCQDSFYRIYVLDDKISAENKQKFVWDQHTAAYELRFIPVNLRGLDKTGSSGAWVPTIYAKYFICDLLNEFEKCIWLDGDTIIQTDLTELYNFDLRDGYMGAVKSPATNYNVAAGKHAVLPREKYLLKCINVGVLLLNLKALRDIGGGSYFLKETMDTVALFPPNTAVTEQDMFNKLLSDNILYLPLKYNLFVDNTAFSERPYYPFCFDRKTIEEAFADPAIIHFTVPEKPWKYSNADAAYAPPFKKYRGLWDSYYRASPLGGQRLTRKKICFIKRFWYAAKPVLKKSPLLLKIKRSICHTHISSPIHDFFD